MNNPITAIIPIRNFNGMTRLSDHLTSYERRTLSMRLATVAVEAASGAGLRVVVVSDDSEVRAWAVTKGADTVDDRGSGLSDSVSAAVEDLGDNPWMVIHADLPLLNSKIVATIAEKVAEGRTVACPSLDGGTNLIGGCGPFEFAYGPGSFTRHLANQPNARVMVDRAVAIEVDTVEHYVALRTLGYAPSLAP